MWQKIFDFARTLWTNGQETRKNSEEIKKLQEQNEQFSMMIVALATRDQEMTRELQYLKESISKDMDNLELRMRVQRLEDLRRLPPGQGDQ